MFRKVNLISLLVLSLFLSSCSWQEYFFVINASSSDITVSYRIIQVDGFPIFDQEVAVYETKPSGVIAWDKKMPASDRDPDQLSFTFTLPSQSALKFGHLSNDSYHNHKQVFINGRVFNLIEMKIIKGKDSLEIKTEQFDDYFKNKKGSIEYVVR